MKTRSDKILAVFKANPEKLGHHHKSTDRLPFYIKFHPRIDKTGGLWTLTPDGDRYKWETVSGSGTQGAQKVRDGLWANSSPMEFVLEYGMAIESAVLRFTNGAIFGQMSGIRGKSGTNWNHLEALNGIRQHFLDEAYKK